MLWILFFNQNYRQNNDITSVSNRRIVPLINAWSEREGKNTVDIFKQWNPTSNARCIKFNSKIWYNIIILASITDYIVTFWHDNIWNSKDSSWNQKTHAELSGGLSQRTVVGGTLDFKHKRWMKRFGITAHKTFHTSCNMWIFLLYGFLLWELHNDNKAKRQTRTYLKSHGLHIDISKIINIAENNSEFTCSQMISDILLLVISPDYSCGKTNYREKKWKKNKMDKVHQRGVIKKSENRSKHHLHLANFPSTYFRLHKHLD